MWWSRREAMSETFITSVKLDQLKLRLQYAVEQFDKPDDKTALRITEK